MANWSNLQLSVFGLPQDIAAFQKDAGRLEGRINTAKSRIFIPEMEYGESGDLQADLPTPFGRRFQRVKYSFQGRNDYHNDHFREVSSRYLRLVFVLMFGDPNGDSHGSFFFLRGKEREWTVSQRLHRQLMMKHYRKRKLVDSRGHVDRDGDGSDAAEWDGYFEMMDLAVVHWDATVLKWLRKQYPRH